MSTAGACFPIPAADIKRIGIVGTGVIGSGWAAIFAAKGYEVLAFVRSAASQDKFLRTLERAWRRLEARGLASDPAGWKAVRCTTSLAECVGTAEYVQESVVEELKLKQEMLRRIDEVCPAHVLVGTSSSFIPLSLVRLHAKRYPHRIATAHPTLPAWDSFVEVLGSSASHTEWLLEMFTAAGMDAVPMTKEMHGHVHNACLNALMTASAGLIHGGVCSTETLDRSLCHMARLILASGGVSGALVGMVGDGSCAAQSELACDIVLGAPVAISACAISRCDRLLPSWLTG